MWKELGGFTEDALVPLGLYGLQLTLNWAWTPLFFGAHKMKLVCLTSLSPITHGSSIQCEKCSVTFQAAHSPGSINSRPSLTWCSSLEPSEPPWCPGIPSAALQLCYWRPTCPGCASPPASTTAYGETTPRKKKSKVRVCFGSHVKNESFIKHESKTKHCLIKYHCE